MASVNPARYFGIEDQMQLFPGKKTSLVAFSWGNNKLSVEKVLK